MHLHKWGKWELQDVVMDGIFTGSSSAVVQIRRCERCGKYQRRPL